MSHDFEQLTITYSEKSLHFLQPAGTSRGVYHERKVWYVEARARYCGRTIYGIGECAPLPQLMSLILLRFLQKPVNYGKNQDNYLAGFYKCIPLF